MSSPRVAIVTGSGRNIGCAIARGFAARGTDVVVADLDGGNAQSVAAEIEAAGGRALAVEVDIGAALSIEKAVGAVVERFGRIDILVNNASRFNDLQRVPFEQIAMEEWRSAMDVNVTGTFAFIRAVAPHMQKSKWGRIVNVSSGSIRMGRPDSLHYVTSKSALIGMSRSLARELGPWGITVNSLLPGVVFTDEQKRKLDPGYQEMILRSQCIPETLTPDSMVGAVLFLCSEGAGHVTGQELAVDGGLTHG